MRARSLKAGPHYRLASSALQIRFWRHYSRDEGELRGEPCVKHRPNEEKSDEPHFHYWVE